MAGTMGRLAIGVTGLQTSQYALNTTAHNLTNTQTEGYTRQQVLLTDMAYNRVSTASYYTNTVGLGCDSTDTAGARPVCRRDLSPGKRPDELL